MPPPPVQGPVQLVPDVMWNPPDCPRCRVVLLRYVDGFRCFDCAATWDRDGTRGERRPDLVATVTA